MPATPLAYPFDVDVALLDGTPAAVLGGKGAGLAEMTSAGLPVPPGFTLTTEACRIFLASGWSEDFDRAVETGMATLEAETGKRLGSADAPLLVSVRSGAEISMPGMMDTVLNLGMNAEVEAALARLTGDPAFAADTHRRALLSFAEVVLDATDETTLVAGAIERPAELIACLRDRGHELPADPLAQIKLAVRAVFESWDAPRAISYREVEGIDPTLGTAATVQTMVFGNLGSDSGTGVAFSRNPITGRAELMGDFLVGAQGEDVVAGDHVTEPLRNMADRWPAVYAELHRLAGLLEHRHRDMVDIEFTVERGRLWLLQGRPGKRSPIAAFRAAIDMAEDPDFPVDRADAVARCRRYFADPPRESSTDASGDLPVIASGLAASPGRGVGVLCLDPDRAVGLRDQGVDVVLARRETSPADVHGMAASTGLFTTLGGQVSHAALVAREWGLPAVVGASEAQLTEGAVIGPGGRAEAGETVTVDGDRGLLLLGRSTVDGGEAPEVSIVRAWAAALEDTGDRPDAPADRAVEVAGSSPATIGPGEAGFRALHGLRIRGMATADVLVAVSGLDEGAARAALDELVALERAKYLEPRGMWVITPAGREAHRSLLAEVVESLDLGAVPYDRFLELNDDVKQLCTDWQVRDGEPNDHDDPDYDRRIIDRLSALDEVVQPVVAAIGEVVPWIGRYGARLTAARDRLLAGDTTALTGVLCDSYHDVWMELHEDLIATQGIDRAAEGST